MPGWLQAVTQVLTAALAQTMNGAGDRAQSLLATFPAAQAQEVSAGPRFCTTFPAAQRHDVTLLLASLVLSTHRLAGLSPRQRYSPCQ